MPPRIFITASSSLSAPLDGSGLKPDALHGGRLSARAGLATEHDSRLLALSGAVTETVAGKLEALDPADKALFFSTSKGGMEAFAQPDPDLGPYLERYASYGPAQVLRHALGWTGGGRNTPLACATGAYSIGLAFEDLRSGRLKAALAGAAEASLTPLIVAAFENLGALSGARSREELRGPFEKFHSGFVLGEGAGALVLESEASLERTGNQAQIELLGWACTCDAYHLTAPEPSGREAARCMQEALKQAGLRPKDVAYVNAHGTGTLAGDLAEANALRRVFGDGPHPRISSIKGATGHTLGAAGAIEAVVTVQAMQSGALPVNVGVKDPMPELADALVLGPETLRGSVALSLNMGFGGHNVALVFRTA